MIKPLEQFYCDECGQLIKEIRDGWVEWIDEEVNGKKHSYGFRIVHHNSCSPLKDKKKDGCYKYNDHYGRSDDHLDNIWEIRNQFLLSFLYSGEFHDNCGENCRITNFKEYAEFARRLTIPYYEEARRYFDKAKSDEYSVDNEFIFTNEDELKKLIEKYEKD